MDLTAGVLRAVAARPHVLLVATPGGTAARLAAERRLRLDDLPLARTPAEADILLVAGPDRPGLRPAVDRLWEHLPAPRARAHAATPDAIGPALDRCRTDLTRPSRAHAGHSSDGNGNGNGARTGDHRNHDVDHHGGHGGMEMPAGLPMAGTGPDRDGLELDQLHVALGPFLIDWPTGLTVRLTLQGDVIQRAELEEPAEQLGDGGDVPFWAEPWALAAEGERIGTGQAARRRAAAHLDSLGRLLAVAGWAGEATTARRLRDALLDGVPGAALRPGVRRFARRVGRSRRLYWLTRGLGPMAGSRARAAGVGGPAARADGDVPARYRTWLADVVRDVDRLAETAPLPADEEGPRGRPAGGEWPSAALARLLPDLLEGAELAAARLIVASLDPDPDELAAAARGVTARD
ncbi:hypothetical protein [Streptomyces sp. RK75]|uniref:hypothetical protein n=1 Tax=Streptomyces sp. RK75 TaxID=2824895 RepID=UPI001B3646BC|nr:hypothetical protein [Streptomyces sp. RK75]MBQ0862758.1 hypothetical protein [Streptomyces sp. RK75]